MNTKLISILLILSIVLSLSFTALSADIKLYVNGQSVSCDVPPIIRNDRTMVPIRAFFDFFGADVAWNQQSQRVTINSGGRDIVLTIGSDIAYVNSVANRLDCVPIIVNSRTLVPIRFISETLNYNVSWDGSTQSVYIQSTDGTVNSTTITSMLYSVSGNHFVIKFTFSSPLSSHNLYNIDNPARIILELNGASYTGSKVIEVGSGGLTKIRTANHEDYYKVVVDMEDVLYKNFVLASNRLSATLSITGLADFDQSLIKTDLQATNDIIMNDNLTDDDIDKDWVVIPDSLVVLDAGHGGTDVGAIGYNADGEKVVQEKDVNLTVTLEVARILRKKGVNVLLTRSDDSSLALSRRYTISNSNNALLFVSIHHNSHTTPDPSGALTLYSAAKDEKYPGLKSSKSIARVIQKHLVEATGLRDGGIRSEDELAVLRGTETSAVLVEVAFVSSYSDQEFLLEEENLYKAAAGIAAGILEVLGR